MKYLGLGARVGIKTWNLMNKKNKGPIFYREVTIKSWMGVKNLANRCLHIKKVKNSIPGRSPVKVASPGRLELSLGIILFAKFF